MSDPYLGEIRMWSFDWAPDGWLLCQGQILNIIAYQALYSLIGTQFGGDGRTTFGLPDLRGRVQLGTQTPGNQQGLHYAGGTETVTLDSTQVPSHIHNLQAIAEAGDKPGPAGNFYAKVTAVSPAPAPVNIYGAPSTPPVTLDAGTMTAAGGSAEHNNMQPFMVLNYCIATRGTYPMRP